MKQAIGLGLGIWLACAWLGPAAAQTAGEALTTEATEEWTPVGEATLYAIGSNRETVLLHSRVAIGRGGQETQMRFVTPEGVAVTTERLLLRDGQFEEYRVVHHEAGHEGRIRRLGERLEFSYTRDGSTQTRAEDYTADFVAGPAITAYIQAHWAEILAGDTLRIRLPIPDRLETIGFKLEMDSRRKTERGEAVVVKMRPASFLLAALVRPVLMSLSEDGAEVWELTGRMTPIRKRDGKLHPTEADAVFRTVGN